MEFEVDLSSSVKDEYDEGGGSAYQAPQKKPYVVDTGNNYIFKEIQVNDINSLITDETVFYEDYDTPVYRAAAMLQEKRIKAICKHDPKIVFDCKNITAFKGRKLNDQVSDSSELGLFNVDLELNGKPTLKPSDFIVEDYQVLNGDEENLLETAKIQLLQSMKNTRLQYGISKITPVLGQGSCFRESLPTSKKYKGNREGTQRPILLKKLRTWMLEERGAIDTSAMLHKGKHIECDDYIEVMAAQGYTTYRKTGRFCTGVISSDKDALNSPKLIINRDTLPKKNKSDKAKLKFPKPMLIEATDRCAGDVVMISKESGKDFKGYGFKFLLYQAILGEDSADQYSAIRHLGLNLGFGDMAAYKVLKPCKSAKESLEASLSAVYDLLPKGVKYTDWTGQEHNVDTMTYLATYFKVAYMIRRLDDDMDLYKLCGKFKVDTSKLVGNNVQSYEDLLSIVDSFKPKLLEATKLLEDKSGKVADRNARLIEAISLLKQLT